MIAAFSRSPTRAHRGAPGGGGSTEILTWQVTVLLPGKITGAMFWIIRTPFCDRLVGTTWTVPGGCVNGNVPPTLEKPVTPPLSVQL